MNISEIRKQYPQYNDLSDEQLIKGLHRKFYSDMPYELFSEKIGLTKEENELPPSLSIDEMKQKAERQLKEAGIDTSFNSINNAFADGFQKWYLGGAERAANGITLGGYDWANRKLGLGSEEREKDLRDIGNGIGSLMKGTEFVSGMIPSVGLWSKAGKIANTVPSTIGKNVSNIAKYPITGAIEGGLSSGFESDFKNAGKGATIGAVASSAIPLGLFGIKKGISKIGSSLLGISTGAGERSIKQAYNAGKRGSNTFLENMRGNVEKEDVVEIAKNNLRNLKMAKNAEYKKAMSEISGKEGVDLKPILDKYKNIVKSEAGGKKYLIDPDTKKFLNQAGKTIKSFQKDKSARTLGDFDNLKQAIGNINVGKEAKRAAQVQSELYNAIKNEIKTQAPTYDKIMRPYSKAAEQVRNIEKSLSLGRDTNVDTALRKLQSSFRNNVSSNYGTRGDLVEKLGGEKLSDAISGQLLNTWMPRGGLARLGAGGLAYTSAKGATNPLGLAAMSPRLVGEIAYKFGNLSNVAGRVLPDSYRMPTLLSIIGNTKKGE